MDKTPFSVYDFFAYLSAGAAILAACDYVTGASMLKSRDFGVVLTILLTIACYVTGQIVSHFSSLLLENYLIRHYLGSPIKNLLAVDAQTGLRGYIFPGYYKRLPKVTREKVLARAQTKNVADQSEGLFLHCYASATATLDKLQPRLDDFRTQYGFSRNMCFALFIAAMIIGLARLRHTPYVRAQWTLACFFGAIAMLFRYLKFYRQYTYELLLRYAEMSISQP